MASRREYEMLFKLNAQLGSSFSSSFNAAKSPIVEMQGEINKLNSLQADISAYTKQQGAVEKLRDKLATLKEQYSNIKSEMESTGNTSATMQNKLFAKQQQIDKTAASLDAQTQKLYGMSDALAAAGVDTDKLAAESAKLDAEIAALKAEQEAAAAATSGFSAEVDALYKRLADISAFQKQQEIVERTEQKLQILVSQYNNIQDEMAETGAHTDELNAKLAAKKQQLDKTAQALSDETGKLDAMDAALIDAGVNTGNLASESGALEAEIRDLTKAEKDAADEAAEFGSKTTNAISNIEQALAAAGIIAALKKIYDAFAACVSASMQFESAMTGVSKTTDLTDSELKEMAAAVKLLSTEIPITAKAFAEIEEVAGQLGVAKEDLLDFSTVMAKLSTATTMTATDAATMLAQFANITQMNPRYYENLASTVVELGNNYATTEQRIVDMSQGLAASASIAGMAEADIAAISAAVSSLGIESASGATSVSKLISTLNTAVETGEDLIDYARVANMTAYEFKQAWGEDAASALATFVTGLNDTERTGKSATLVLSELGITEARMQRMMLSLAGSGDLLNNTLSNARSAWAENTALTAEAEKRYATTESRLQMLSNAFDNLKISIGDNVTPALQGIAPVATDALNALTAFIDQHPGLVRAVTTAIAVIGGAAAALTAYAGYIKIAAAMNALFTSTIPGLNVIMAVTAGVAVLTGGVVALTAAIRDSAYDFQERDENFDALNEEIERQMMIADLCDEYFKLNKELGGTSQELKSIEGTRTIKLTAEQQATLKAEGFMVEGEAGEKVWLVPGLKEQLEAAGFFFGDSTAIELTPAQREALKAAGYFFDDTEAIELTPAQRATLKAAGYFFDDAEAIELTPAQREALKAAGYFFDDTDVILTPIVDGALSAYELLQDDTATINLTPRVAKTLAANGFLTNMNNQVALTAAATGKKIDPNEFVSSDTAQIAVAIAGYEDTASKLTALQGLVNGISTSLASEKAALSELETRKTELDAIFAGEATYTVVVDYQSDKGLSADGICREKHARRVRGRSGRDQRRD